MQSIIDEKTKKDIGVWKRLFGIMKDKGITDSQFEQALGIGKGMVSHWRNDGRNTYLQYINAICEYLDTTPNYLFQGVESRTEPDILTSFEKDIIVKYRMMDDRKQRHIREEIDIFLGMDDE